MDKIFIKGELTAICPVCGLHIPVTVSDIINESMEYHPQPSKK